MEKGSWRKGVMVTRGNSVFHLHNKSVSVNVKQPELW